MTRVARATESFVESMLALERSAAKAVTWNGGVPIPPELRVVPGGRRLEGQVGPGMSQTPAQVGRLVGVTEPHEVDELVRRAQQGDRSAFAELFRRHRGDVGRLVFRMLGPTADAE